MRFFPGAPLNPLPGRRSGSRSRRLALLVVVALTAVGLLAPFANAEDEDRLQREQRQVQQKIEHKHDELEHASRRVARATHRLEAAQTQLRKARSRLQRVRGDLADARRQATRLKRELAAAQRRLDTAEADLRAARDEVAQQRQDLRGTVLDLATAGDPNLAMLSSFMDSGSIRDMLVNETASDMVVGREDQALDALELAEQRVEERKEEIEDARDDVARKKQAAQRNVARVRRLYAEAKLARDRVDNLVDRTRTARRHALAARAKDREALQRLRAREQRIKRRLMAMADRNPGASYTGVGGGFLQMPVNGYVTSPFGYRRHPIYGYYGLHNGTDFGAGCGAPLYAGHRGRVVATYWDPVYGKRLYLAIGRVNGAHMTLVYNHLSRWGVRKGTYVRRGQRVGFMGSTGWSTGCHLHFTVLRNGRPVNPMNYL